MLAHSRAVQGAHRALCTAGASAEEVYDVAIVGAGMVGAAVAALLSECLCLCVLPFSISSGVLSHSLLKAPSHSHAATNNLFRAGRNPLTSGLRIAILDQHVRRERVARRRRRAPAAAAAAARDSLRNSLSAHTRQPLSATHRKKS
jgi:3-hydroxyacyl-CoA dehydrogenase